MKLVKAERCKEKPLLTIYTDRKGKIQVKEPKAGWWRVVWIRKSPGMRKEITNTVSFGEAHNFALLLNALCKDKHSRKMVRDLIIRLRESGAHLQLCA